MDTRPVEVYCPVCGYKTFVNDPDDTFRNLSHDEKVARVRELQKSDSPVFLCSGCDDPKATADILDIR